MDHSKLHARVWYQMMKLYKSEGSDLQVIQLYKEYQMLHDESEPDEYFFNLVMRLDPRVMKHPKNKDIYSNACRFIHKKMKENQSSKYLSHSLLDYYRKINDLKGVIDTFNEMDIKHKDKYVYGKIIKFYSDNDMNSKVIEIFNGRLQMIDDVSCAVALKACSNMKDKENGKKIHHFILKNGKYNCIKNTRLSNALITFYGRIGEIETAIKMFDQISSKDKTAVCYNAMMQAYLDNDMNDEAVKLFFSSEISDDVSCLLALKACGNLKDEESGNKICQFILYNTNYNSWNNIQLFTTLITFYGKIGEIEKAIAIFDQINNKDKTVVGAMMQAYLDTGMNQEAIKLFFSNEMIDHVSCLLALKACSNVKDKKNGKKIHKFILDNANCNIELFTTLIAFYGKIGEIEKAVAIFNEIENKDKTVVCYNAMMQAYLENDMNDQVIRLFFSNEMDNGRSDMIDDVSCLLALKACSNNKDEQNGKKIERFILSNKNYHSLNNVELFTTLITFYGKIGEIEKAVAIFDSQNDSCASVVCCNAMMQAYLDNNMDDQVIKVFFGNKMHNESHEMIDDVSCLLALKACGNMNDKKNGEKIHKYILHNTNYNSWNNIQLFTTLIAFYGKIGETAKAIAIFDQISSKDKTAVCYGAMMQAYLDNNMNKEVIKLFFSNEIQNTQSTQMIDHVSLLLMLKACGNAKSYYEYVKEIDTKIRWNNSLLKNGQLVSQLISCYGNCGYVEEGEAILNEYLRVTDFNKESVTVLSSMMNSYGRRKLANKAIDLFFKLKNDAIYSKHFDLTINSLNMEDIETISILYLTLISGCSHSCLVNESRQFYDEYDGYYNIVSSNLKMLKHDNINHSKLNELEIFRSKVHCALVDTFARKGLLDQAWQFCVEFENNILSEQSFLALLSGCRNYNNQDMARKTYSKIEHLVLSRNTGTDCQLLAQYRQSMMASSSVLLHHTLTSLGKYNEANEINLRRMSKGWKKQRGKSEIVIPGDDPGTVHSFTAGDDYKKDYPNYWQKMDQLWNKWQVELKKYGFEHNHNSMTRQLKESETVEYVLCRHAEKLALAYGILRIKNKNTIIHINKNMRMCADCHEAIKKIAQIEAREIRVADAHVIHIFDGKGNCSCGDYY